MTGEWVTAGEACDLLGVTRRELYRMIDAGELEARRTEAGLEVLAQPRPPLRLVT